MRFDPLDPLVEDSVYSINGGLFPKQGKEQEKNSKKDHTIRISRGTSLADSINREERSFAFS